MAFFGGKNRHVPFAAYPPDTNTAFGEPTATPPHASPTRINDDEAAAKANALKSPTKLSQGVEGTVSFKSQLFASYRYRISTKDDKLRIWIEDVKSKKQWHGRWS